MSSTFSASQPTNFESSDKNSLPSSSLIQGRELIESREFSVANWQEAALQVLRRREAVLRAASFAASHFMRWATWQEHLPAVLEQLGRAADVSRAYIFQARFDESDNEFHYSPLSEWGAYGIESRTTSSRYQNFTCRDFGLGRWGDLLEKGQSVHGNLAQLPESESQSLQSHGILSLALVPVVCDGTHWGFLGFDETRTEREWDETEIETLHLTADILGATIARQHADEALRRSEQELRAVFAAMRDAIFVLDRNGYYRDIVSTNSHLFYRPRNVMLGKSVEEVVGGELAQRFMTVIREVVDSRQSQSIEYDMSISGADYWFVSTITPLDTDTVLWVARDETEANRAQQTLAERESLFRLIAESSVDSISIIRPDGVYSYASPVVFRLLGFTPTELTQFNAFDLVHADDLITLRRKFGILLRQAGNSGSVTYRYRHKKGHWIWLESNARSVVNSRGELEAHIISRDVSERRQAEEALRQAEMRYRSIFENAIEGIFQTTSEGRYLSANPSLAVIYGFSSSKEMMEELTDIGHQLYVDPYTREEFVEQMQREGTVSRFESQIRRKDGSVIWISENARAVYDEAGHLLYYEGTVEDVTARKNAEDQLLHNALHDRLTGLANRVLFADRLSHALSRLRRHPEYKFAVLFLDSDRFKNINDSLGHMVGDQLLIAIASRLTNCLRPEDTISRLGGDEFAILIHDVGTLDEAITIAERIHSCMAPPFELAGQRIFSSFSIGITLSTPEYQAPEELLRDADMAMYRAKSQGQSRHAVFDAGMHTNAVALLQLETDLRWAIERQEFFLSYQPIISLVTQSIVGFEALLRWQHPQRGVIHPGEFISVAEETGWIVPLGRWVLEEACRQLARWQYDFSPSAPLTIAVNLSPKQFVQEHIVEDIKQVLLATNIAPEHLKLEITESVLMEESQSIESQFRQLHELGVKLSLDDFGTGYSSLSYLHRYPLDALKIDRSFVARMLHHDSDFEIVRSILNLSAGLNMEVIAEGVELESQIETLRNLGCQFVQGFYFAHPLSAEAATQLLHMYPH